jgi:hypothetical protein
MMLRAMLGLSSAAMGAKMTSEAKRAFSPLIVSNSGSPGPTPMMVRLGVGNRSGWGSKDIVIVITENF